MKIGLIILLVIIGLMIIFFAITEVMFHITFRAFQIDPVTALEHYEDFKDKYKREIVHFKSGKNRLQGYIYGDTREDRTLIVFSHGIWSGPEEYMTMLSWFLDKGYTIFTYDYTSYNGSEGKCAKGLPQSPLDQKAALDFVESEPRLKKMKKVTLGHSWGAYATTAGLHFDHDIVAACAMSGFNDPVKISVETGKIMLGPLAIFMKPFVCLLNRVRFGKYARLYAVDGINHANIPVLLTHGNADDFIVYDVSSIVCQQDQMNMENVSILTIEEEGRNGHNDFFLSKDAATYMKQITAKYEALKKQYKKGRVPDKVKKEFFQNVDKKRANAPAEDLYQAVDAFFKKAVGAELEQ